jgi:hypothetical protein
MKVIVSKEDSWKLDSSMFIIDGSWETGYVYDKNIFFMVGVTTFYEEGASSPVSLGFEPSTQEMKRALRYLKQAQKWVELGKSKWALKDNESALYWIRAHNLKLESEEFFSNFEM